VATTVMDYFANIKNAFTSIFHGLSVTFSYLFRKPTTIQYPDRVETPVQQMLPPLFRGILEVDTALCIGCNLCEKTCPIGCLRMVVVRDPETNQRYITRFDVDVAKCMVCGLCSENCPTGAVRHSTEFEASTANVVNLVYRYVKPGERVPVHKPVKGEESPGLPQNEPITRARKEWDEPPPIEPDKVRGKVRWKTDGDPEKEQ